MVAQGPIKRPNLILCAMSLSLEQARDPSEDEKMNWMLGHYENSSETILGSRRAQRKEHDNES